jgi:hypothetical protein
VIRRSSDEDSERTPALDLHSPAVDDLTGDDHAAGTLGAYLDPECSVPLPAWGDGPG